MPLGSLNFKELKIVGYFNKVELCLTNVKIAFNECTTYNGFDINKNSWVKRHSEVGKALLLWIFNRFQYFYFLTTIILFLLKCLILNHHQYCFVNSSSLIFRYFIHIQTRNLIGINRNTLEYLWTSVWPRPLDVCALKLCTHIIISTTPLALPFLLTLSTPSSNCICKAEWRVRGVAWRGDAAAVATVYLKDTHAIHMKVRLI